MAALAPLRRGPSARADEKVATGAGARGGVRGGCPHPLGSYRANGPGPKYEEAESASEEVLDAGAGRAEGIQWRDDAVGYCFCLVLQDLPKNPQ